MLLSWSKTLAVAMLLAYLTPPIFGAEPEESGEDPEASHVDEVMEDFAHLPKHFSLAEIAALLDRPASRVRIPGLASYAGNSAALYKEIRKLRRAGITPSIFSLGPFRAKAFLKTAFSGELPVETTYDATAVLPFTASETLDEDRTTPDDHKEWTSLKMFFDQSSVKISQAQYTYPPTMLHRHFADMEKEYGPYEGVATYIYDHARPEMTEVDVDRTACTSYQVYLPQREPREDMHIATFMFTPTDRRFATMPLAPKDIRDGFRSAVAFCAGPFH